jgi:hypothetical protein
LVDVSTGSIDFLLSEQLWRNLSILNEVDYSKVDTLPMENPPAARRLGPEI